MYITFHSDMSSIAKTKFGDFWRDKIDIQKSTQENIFSLFYNNKMNVDADLSLSKVPISGLKLYAN